MFLIIVFKLYLYVSVSVGIIHVATIYSVNVLLVNLTTDPKVSNKCKFQIMLATYCNVRP